MVAPPAATDVLRGILLATGDASLEHASQLRDADPTTSRLEQLQGGLWLCLALCLARALYNCVFDQFVRKQKRGYLRIIRWAAVGGACWPRTALGGDDGIDQIQLLLVHAAASSSGPAVPAHLVASKWGPHAWYVLGARLLTWVQGTWVGASGHCAVVCSTACRPKCCVLLCAHGVVCPHACARPRPRPAQQASA